MMAAGTTPAEMLVSTHVAPLLPPTADPPLPARRIGSLKAFLLFWLMPRRYGPHLAVASWKRAITAHVLALVDAPADERRSRGLAGAEEEALPAHGDAGPFVGLLRALRVRVEELGGEGLGALVRLEHAAHRQQALDGIGGPPGGEAPSERRARRR